MKTLLTALAVAFCTLSAAAQAGTEPPFSITCQDQNWSGNKESRQFCETRDLTMNAPVGQALTLDGGTNGGVEVHGWAGPNVRVRARVQSWARTEAEAQAQVKAVRISTANHALRATASSGQDNWSVSYEVFVPRQTALTVRTVNGGIRLDNLQTDVQFHAVNGGVSLANLGGQVTGETVNGGLSINLTGTAWEGKGLDVATTNGGIRWNLPERYSARLFTSTNMGNISTDLPVTKSGLLHKEVVASLGQGGAPVKAVTTNGSVKVAQGKN